ncbi:MAG TPA: ABC transporter substrate-binding protein [Bacteroidia bacterium]|jgi:peptide/nickel transport system substrate-binding protein|nr:ABC transporter substrate-binding protein [Bacteroidia bacterium]
MRSVKQFFILCGALLFLGGARIGNTDSRYGGIFRMNLTEDFSSLYPPSIVDAPSKHIAEQIYEGLLKYDPQTLKLLPWLAKSWVTNADNTVFTFGLRTNVFFQDDNCFPNGKGRKMTAGDVKFCFGELLKQTPQNYSYESTFSSIVSSDSAFVVVNDSTFSIHTLRPCYYLTEIVAQPACSIYPHEALEKYGDDMRTKCVGTGPFSMKSLTEGDFCILQKNQSYWRKDTLGNQLPYLDNIKFTFVKEKKSEMIAFKNDELDLEMDPDADVLASLINDNMSDFAAQHPVFMLDHTSNYSLFYIGFRDDIAPFDNYKVRQAFNMAIDKDRIVDEILKGGGNATKAGFLPAGLPGYTSTASPYPYDVNAARQLMKEAGYPNGKKFPEIELESISPGASSVSIIELVQEMLKESIGVNVKLKIVPFSQWLDDVQNGKAKMWYGGWMAGDPDPREFLQLAYCKNVPKDTSIRSQVNPMRFCNPDFDAFYERALTDKDDRLRMKDFASAEQTAMDYAFIVPLYYPDRYVIYHANVRGYMVNSLDMRDLGEVYFGKGK